MSTYEAFNHTVISFVQELVRAFPEEEGFATALSRLRVSAELDPKSVLNILRPQILGSMERILQRDEGLISEFSFAGMDFAAIWASAALENREMIWQYLMQIAFMVQGLSFLNDKALAALEEMMKNISGV